MRLLALLPFLCLVAGCGNGDGEADQFPVIVVTNLNDIGPGSLRQALLDLETDGTVTFDPGLTGTIMLEAPIFISRPANIIGPGAAVIAVSGGNQVRVFDLGALSVVVIEGLTIQNGDGSGGGVLNRNDVTLRRVVIKDCNGRRGGGLQNRRATATLEDVWISNCSGLNGGGFANDEGTLTMTACTVSGCSAIGAGGVTSGILHMLNTTFSANMTLLPTRPAGGLGIFADMESDFGDVLTTAIHCTFTSNEAPGDGGGILVMSDGPTTATLDIRNSIAAQNMGLTRDISNQGVVNSDGNNVIGVGTGSGIVHGVDGNQVGTLLFPVDAMLGALTEGLGATPVHPIGPGSPAIDVVPVADCTDRNGSPVTVDQVDTARPAGALCDAGSYEDD